MKQHVFTRALGEISKLLFECFRWTPEPEKRREILGRIRDITDTALKDG